MAMTDAELEALYRKHVPRNAWHVDPRGQFVGSPFYAFARELEHHALATGMLVGASDPVRPIPPDTSTRAGSPARAGLAGLFSWLWS